MTTPPSPSDTADAPDAKQFDELVAKHRGELHAYCYRMLGSLHDAEDALQEAFIGAWRGLSGFEGRSSLRSWLYRIATHACLRIIEARPKRVLPSDNSAPATGTDVERFVEDPIWLDPYPESASDSAESQEEVYVRRESLELAFVAALQHLPGTQRATLILREVLGFSAADVADQLGTTVASVNSALQRARGAVESRVPPISQQAALKELGDAAQRELVRSYIAAWAKADVNTLVALLAEDAQFTMPPIPTWFDGKDAVARFFRERVFATPWRLVETRANGQLAFACYQGPDFRLGALNVVTLRNRSIYRLTGFLEPKVHRIFRLPER
jgi:RNA polymerase sigma-70 factor (ECF subfamily)